MKTAMFILVACAATFACAKAVGPVPLEDAVFVDTEASTNVPQPVCTGDPHVFSFTMDFAGSPSNAVEIAFGVDADADGRRTPLKSPLALTPTPTARSRPTRRGLSSAGTAQPGSCGTKRRARPCLNLPPSLPVRRL